ncbi:MAG: hypothetical protein ABSA52_13580 [Candidatus Binatia bacterium]|jgi:hypothetical protein
MGTGPAGLTHTQATAEPQRGRILSIFAVLFMLLAISDLLKPFGFGGSETGFVFLGRRLSGPANAIMGPLFGIFLLIYAFRIWRMKRSALVMGYLYAAYVIINLTLFNLRNPVPPGIGYLIFGIVYAIGGIGVSCGAVYLLSQRRAVLK